MLTNYKLTQFQDSSKYSHVEISEKTFYINLY